MVRTDEEVHAANKASGIEDAEESRKYVYVGHKFTRITQISVKKHIPIM